MNIMDKRRLSKKEIEETLYRLYGKSLFITDINSYKNMTDDLLFTCMHHGNFVHNLRSMINGSGCPHCNLIKKISLILFANSIKNEIVDDKIILENGTSIGINGCDINISITDNVYDILSEKKIIYNDKNVKEKWKALSEFSHYKISNLGRVKNIKTKKILNGYNMNKSGHIQKMINLYDDKGKLHGILLHRLVYSVFKGAIDSDKNIDHIDGNFLNNRLSNLRVCNNIKDNINNEITILTKKISIYNKRKEKKAGQSHDYNVKPLDNEIWVDLFGMEDLYEVSNLGRIRSKVMAIEYNRKGANFIVNRASKLLKQHIKSKYMFISLGKNNNRVHLPVHKIVYESFNGKIGDGLEVDHINGICTDNRLCNLQTITHNDNLKKRKYKKDRL